MAIDLTSVQYKYSKTNLRSWIECRWSLYGTTSCSSDSHFVVYDSIITTVKRQVGTTMTAGVIAKCVVVWPFFIICCPLSRSVMKLLITFLLSIAIAIFNTDATIGTEWTKAPAFVWGRIMFVEQYQLRLKHIWNRHTVVNGIDGAAKE